MVSVYPFFVAATLLTCNVRRREQYTMDFASAIIPYHEEFMSSTEISSVTAFGVSQSESQVSVFHFSLCAWLGRSPM
jgi:hypothetical protein